MKITLDLSKLVKQEKLTHEEARRLIVFAQKEDSSHALGILSVLALIAIALGFIGLNLAAVSEFLRNLESIFGPVGVHFLILIGAVIGSYLTRSGFLAGISVFVILSLLSYTNLYSKKDLFVSLSEPAVTIFIFSFLAIAALSIAEKVEYDIQRLVIIFARTCLIVVNLCFWIGSVFGGLNQGVFIVLWTVVLLAVGFWGVQQGLFTVNRIKQSVRISKHG